MDDLGSGSDEAEEVVLSSIAGDERWCRVCDIHFKYPSKLNRHLKTAKHKLYEASCGSDYFAAETNDNGGVSDGDTFGDSDTLPEPTVDTGESDTSCDIGNEVEYDKETNSDSSCTEPDIHSETDDVFDLDEIMDLTSLEQGDTYPFPNARFALLYLLLHSPRPVGEGNMRFICRMLQREDPSSPSLSQLRKFTLPGFSAPIKHYGDSGVPLYVNSPVNIVRQCMGTPHIAASLSRYPCVNADCVTEMCQAQRWLTDPIYSAVMITHPDHIFVRDFVMYNHHTAGSNTIARVESFFNDAQDGHLKAKVTPLFNLWQFSNVCQHSLPLYADDEYYIIGPSEIIPVSSICDTLSPPARILRLDSRTDTFSILNTEEMKEFVSPAPIKVKARGRPVVSVPLLLYSDDLSGNRTKKWNCFNVWCLMLAGLPKELNAQHENIHLMSASNKVPVLQMAIPIVQYLLVLQNGTFMYDAHLQQEVMVVAPVLAVMGDNPRASEIAGHLTGNPNKFCRQCMCDRRNPSQACAIREKSVMRKHFDDIAEASPTAKAQLKTQYGLPDHPSPLIKLHLDLYQSTPIETLHTLLLGPYKYLLRKLMARLSAKQKIEIGARIKALSFSGFKSKLTSDICHYVGSLVGRDFKMVAQVAPFVLAPYFDVNEKEVWLSLSKVFKFTYCDPYQHYREPDYTEMCQSFVQSVMTACPNLGKKPKVHLLLHLPQNMLHFGPPSAYNTERCESFNSLVRSQNIYSNRQSPSRDIGTNFAIIQYLRYIVAGGQFGKHKQRCGSGLGELFQSPFVQQFLNGSTTACSQTKCIQSAVFAKVKRNERNKPQYMFFGSVTLESPFSQTTHTVIEATSRQLYTLQSSEVQSPQYDDKVSSFGAVRISNGVMINTGNCVKCTVDGEERIAILLACVQRMDGAIANNFCIVNTFDYLSISPESELICNDFDCPLLLLSSDVYFITPRAIFTAVSVVHECSRSCTFKEVLSSRIVERENVQCHQTVFEHDWCNNVYCLNVYCMPL